MAENTKIDDQFMLDRLRPGAPLLPPLVIRGAAQQYDRTIDALIDVSFAADNATERFTVECNTRSTPEVFRKAIHQASENAQRLDCYPMIFLPYLSPSRLDELEALAVSGIDLCGNGIVYVPNHMCVLRTGHRNLYPDSRPLANPYRGRSALVARMLITHRQWDTLSELTEAIEKQSQLKGLSLSQVSKAISASVEEMIVTKEGNTIKLTDPVRLLDNLGKGWRPRPPRRQRNYRSLDGKPKLSELSRSNKLAWSLTGESSATRYCTIVQGGPVRVAVSDLKLAESLLPLTAESVPSFSDIVLIETKDDEYFFANERDDEGIRYAGRIQTWLELNNGDARQRETAKDLYQAIIQEAWA
ncbi:MAG: hypothetical protein ABI557_02280 [Aureliella sp.]